MLLKNTAEKILDWIFPPVCLNCRNRVLNNGDLCHECWNGLNFNCAPYCQRCAFPFEIDWDAGDNNTLCGKCLQNDESFILTKLRFALVYNNKIGLLINGFKYQDNLRFANIFGKWMIQHGDEIFKDIDIITCIPLHFLRLLGRKYNQSALLVNVIADHNDKLIKYNDLLIRRKNIIQGLSSYKQRQTNVKNLFKKNDKYNITGKNILIVDDVYTTGATMNSCAKLLLKAGAKNVFGLCLSRVIRK